MSYKAFLDVALQAADAGEKVVRHYYDRNVEVEIKEDGTPVTIADVETEKAIKDVILGAFPDHGFYGEETGKTNADAEYLWLIDPIDGTTNFIHAIPYVCISVAAQEKTTDGWQTIVAVVYDPVHDELFTAIKGEGAQVNGYRLRVSGREEDWLFSTTSPRTTRKNFEETIAAFTRVSGAGAVVRCSGSAALDLAYVAAGRLDGTWYHYLNAWDMAAGTLLVTEAGGQLSQISGEPLTDNGCSIVAASSAAYTPLSKALIG